MSRALALATIAAIAVPPSLARSYTPSYRRLGVASYTPDPRRKPRGVDRADKRLARKKAAAWRRR